jgi:uncharacterized repeat protein (TIGR01451 family)
MKVNMYSLALALVAGCAATMGGCENQSVGSGSNYGGNVPHASPGASYRSTTKAAPAATPVARTEPAPARTEPAPAPRMMSTGTVMYVPTGDRASSALMIEKIYPTQVTVGQPFDYIIKATNISAQSLNNVSVTEQPPSNFTLVSANPQGVNGVYNLGTLNAGESKTITLRGSAAGIGTINACASATYTTALCSTINVVQPALSIVKTITPESILNCSPISMTIEVKNSGTGTASNVVVTDSLPAGLTIAGGSANMTESLGDIGPGQSKTITKNLSAASVGSFNNVASVKADGVNSVNSNQVTTVVKQPKLELTCKAGGKVMMGRKACYELTVRNTGNAVAAATTIALTLPAGVTADSGNSISIGDLAPGATQTKTICITGGAMGTVPLSAVATGTCAAPANTNCTVEFIGVPDIGTLVTDDDGVVEVGNPHNYRVEVANQGQINLTNVRMVVTLPAGMEFVSSPMGKLEGGKVVFNFGTVAAGARPTSNFVVRSTKSGELLVVGETTCSEIKTPIRDDELTNFVDK